jgi:hypothetical protein
MRVFIANFGLKNYEWKECLARSTIAVMNHPDHHVLWKAGKFEEFIESGLRHRTYRGKTPDRNAVEGWYTDADTFRDTEGDLWIHRANRQIWWTISRPGKMDEYEKTEPKPSLRRTVVSHKPCDRWSNEDGNKRVLEGAHLHPRDLDFFQRPRTLFELKGIHRDYAIALVKGDDLSSWRSDPEWLTEQWYKSQRTKNGGGRRSSAYNRTMKHMMDAAYSAEQDEFEELVLKKTKNKKVRFLTRAAFMRHVDFLYRKQKGRCALTGLELQLIGEHTDTAMLCSLDRKNSDGHYEIDNLQVVCRFANFWKRATEDTDFKRLVDVIRKSPAP